MTMKPNPDSPAFKAGVADALEAGTFNYPYKDSLNKEDAYNYKCGYDYGLTMYADQNELD